MIIRRRKMSMTELKEDSGGYEEVWSFRPPWLETPEFEETGSESCQ
jgi:hypothetical protein